MKLARLRVTPAGLALALIFLVLSASTAAWVLKDRTPPPWDPADHISAAYDYYAQLAHLNFRGFADEFFVEPHYYAPLVHLTTASIFIVLGASRLTGIAVNLLSLALLLYSINWIGRKLYSGDEQLLESDLSSKGVQASSRGVIRSIATPGVIAALLTTCYHFPAWLLHDAFLDYPLLAITAFSVKLLIQADDFSSSRRAILFGLVAGLGMLTKQTYPFFLFLPAVYVTGRVLWSRKLKPVGNLLLSGLVAVAAAAIWYAPHLNDVISIYRVNQEAAINENEAPLFSFMSNAFYVHGLISEHIQILFGGLFFIGLIFSLIRFRSESVLLYLWLLSGMVGFALVANKDLRYTVPILPAVALLSVCWLGAIRGAGRASMSFRFGSAALIAVWAFVSFFNAQWPRDGMGKYIDMPRFRWMVFARNYFGFDHRPLSDDWGVTEVIRAVEADAAEGDRGEPLASSRPMNPLESVSPTTRLASAGAAPRVGVIVNLPYVNPSSTAMYARLLSHQRAGNPVVDVDWIVVESAKDRLERCQYIVVRTGLDKADWVSPMERYMDAFIKEHPERFHRLAGFPIPMRDAETVVYRLK
ncbi:MAG: hypothetical protein DMF61_05885 [Blastocatellia bacterium AA13]|nr:MAG: hypothetical protein DMF61_05885 [Blastocatellia bacterium AA13]